MSKAILLVEDNATDEKLTLVAFFWLLLNEPAPAPRRSS
jgi:hypothetical protein